MEWREQSTVGCEEAYLEAQRWLEAVTKKEFGGNNFRSALENGVLLCDLINNIKPGIIKRVNRLSTPIAGLDNLNVFLKACGKIGLKEAQLFHPGDLQDLSTRVTVKHQETNRRLKNVLITLYWLGRRAHCDPFYDGPYLNLKAFEGLLGTALAKALEDSSSQRGSSVRDSGFGDSWYSEREELFQLRGGGGGVFGGGRGGGRRREDSLDSLDSLGSRPHSVSSDTTLKGSSEGCCSDAEADSLFRMAENKESISYRRSAVVAPKAATQFNQFLPTKDKVSAYVPAPLRKKKAERHEDSRRSWVGPTYTEEDGTFTRSKSMSDILVDPAVLRQVRYEELQKLREQVKETDDQWQDDLTKWKNRRKSVNSDIVKKKEEREHVEQVTYTAPTNRRSKTFKEMQEGRGNRDRSSIGSRLSSLSHLVDEEDVFDHPVPSSRTYKARSNTIDVPYSSADRPRLYSEPSVTEEDPPAAAPSTDRAVSPPPTTREVDIVGSPAGSDTTTTSTTTSSSSYTSVPKLYPPTAAPTEMNTGPALEHTTTSTAKSEESPSAVYVPRTFQAAPEAKRPLAGTTRAESEAPSSGSLYKQPPTQYNSMEPKPPGVYRVSASLPRSYQRSDSERLTSVVTPRPFGTQSTRIASLPRAVTMDDPHKRVNGDVSVSTKSSVPSRYHQFMTSEDEAQSHSSSARSSEDEEEEDGESGEQGVGAKKQSISPVPVPQVRSVPVPQVRSVPVPQVRSEAPVSPAPQAKDTNQESYCDMRINLNQKPNSSRDFGFQADWDSTGAHVSSIQTGTPAEMCQLQVSDEVLTVNGHRVADMSYADWKGGMEQALQQGTLVMDIRRHGKNSASDTKTVNTSLDFTSRLPTDTLTSQEAPPTHTTINVASNGMNGGFREEPVTMRNKDSEPISMKNLKRRSEFFEQGGSETVISDVTLPVPTMTPSSNRWSWDPEEERRRQEKWQKEQERLLQEKYKRDQEKMQEEWLKAQQEVATSKESDVQEPQLGLQVNSHPVSPHSPLSPFTPVSPLSQASSWGNLQEEAMEDAMEDERKRREEQECQRQAEEKRRREEEERELQRLQEERKRREQQEEEERKRMEEEELRWQRRKEEERAEEERRRRAAELQEQQRRETERALELQEQQRREKERALELQEQQRREKERALELQEQQQQWGGESYGFVNVQPELSFADRAKSKSTPHLDEVEKPQSKGLHGQLGGMTHWLVEEELRRKGDKRAQIQRAASELELERRHILNAMRYRQPERVTGSGAGETSWRDSQKKGQSQAELERQQILQEMKKKTPLLTDNSWIRQRAAAAAVPKEPVHLPMRRGESLDNLDTPRNSWRSSWTPGSTSSIPNYSRPHSALSGGTASYGVVGGGQQGAGGPRPSSATLPSSYSMGSLRGGAGTPSSAWSQHSSSPSPSSPSPTTSPEPPSESRPPQHRSRSVSGKKICTFCDSPLGKGAAMIIESLGLCYHLGCFKCIDCKSDLGGSEIGAEVRIRSRQLYCNSCYNRLKTGQPTPM